jgi:hypothetical protein
MLRGSPTNQQAMQEIGGERFGRGQQEEGRGWWPAAGAASAAVSPPPLHCVYEPFLALTLSYVAACCLQPVS